MNLFDLIHSLNINRYEMTSVLLFVIGLGGLIFNRNLFKKIVSISFMDTAIYLFLTANGGVMGHLAPIVLDPSVQPTMEVYTNPLPAGLVLTGIVVSVSFTAFGLALTLRLYKKYRTLNLDEIIKKMKQDEE